MGKSSQLKIVFYACLFVVTSFTLAFAQDFQICPAANEKDDVQVYQGLNGWLFHPGDLVEDAELSKDVLEQFKRVKAAFDYRGIQVVVAAIPTRAMFHQDQFDLSQAFFSSYDNTRAETSYYSLLKQLNGLGFTTPDLLDGIKTRGHPESFAYSRDSHWSPIGASDAAFILAESLKSLSSFQDIPSVNFELLPTTIRDRETDLAKYAKEVCPGITIPTEPQQLYELNNLSNNDLFANTAGSEVVLWGTSYSKNSNFDLFLQNYSGVEITNQAIAGGGAWSSLLDYFLNTSEFAKIAVWEFPLRGVEGQLNVLKDYREIVPTLYGDCSNNQPVLESKLFSLSSTGGLNTKTFPFDQWKPINLTVNSDQPDPQGGKGAIKLTFNGHKDPKLDFIIETGKVLKGQTFRQSVWLWTDENQPKNAALYLYSHPEPTDLGREKITLSSIPTLFTFEHTFEDDAQTAFHMRIDGLEGSSSEDAQALAGTYMYAFSPQLEEKSAEPLTIPENAIDGSALKSNLELLKLDTQDVQNHKSYVEIELSDLSLTEYDLVFHFQNGQADTYHINRSNRINNNGKFFVDLPNKDNALLESIHLSLPEEASGTARALVCPYPN